MLICPACPVIAMAGSAISAYFGFDRKDLRPHAIVATTALMGVTVVALRLLLGISLCDGNGNFSLRNIAQVGAISLVMGLIITIGVRVVLNKLIPPPTQPPPPKACCCKNTQEGV